MGKLLSTTQAAERLGLSVPRVQNFIWDGRLPAEKVGRSYAINEDDLALVADRKPGRPPKSKDEPAKVAATAAPDTAEADATEAKPKRARKAKAAKPKRAGKKAKVV